jgi:hypothetical protein
MQMANRIAIFSPAIFASLIAGGLITGAASTVVRAAGECQTEPGNEARQGQHWYYRIERGTKRHCWYQREEGERAEQAASSGATAAASPKGATAVAGSMADARDELPSPGLPVQQDVGASAVRRARANVPTVATTEFNQKSGGGVGSTDGILRSPVASRPPEPTVVDSPVSAPQETSATIIADADPAPQAEPPSAPAPVTLAAAAAPIQKAAGTPQMLLLVILGALTLASLMGRLIYRLGRARYAARAAERRRDIWESADPARDPSSASPQTENLFTPADLAGRHDFEQVHIQAADIQASYQDDQAGADDNGVEEIEEFIEDFLVRLSNRSHSDMESVSSR